MRSDGTAGFTDICYDSRTVRQGALFVALAGDRTDGHLYVNDAVNRGARGLIVQQGAFSRLPPECRPLVVCAVPDTRLALGHLAADFYRHPSRRLFTIGVTGTNGKTTVTQLVQHIWNTAARRRPRHGLCGSIGTLGISAGDDRSPSTLTTPEAPDIHRALADMARSGVKAAVLEVSSQGIARHRVEGIRFDVAALTHISPDHSDIHPSFEAYRDLKLAFLLRQPRRVLLAADADSEHTKTLLERDRYPHRIFTCGWSPRADVRITACRHLAPAGLLIDLRLSPRAAFRAIALEPATFAPTAFGPAAFPGPTLPGVSAGLGRRIQVKSSLVGHYQASNVAMAVLISVLAGIDLPSIAQGVESFSAPERRMELHTLRGRTVIDDTAMNPASYDHVFQTAHDLGNGLAARGFARRTTGRYLLVSAIRGSRGARINRDNAAVIAGWARRLPIHSIVLTDAADRVGEYDRVHADERLAVTERLRTEGIPWHFEAALDQAIHAIWRASRPGDIIMLLGAQGMDDGRRLLETASRARDDAARFL